MSIQVLLEAFPQGLEAHDPEKFRTLKQAYQEWLAQKNDRGIHHAWIQWVLQEILDFPDEVLLTNQAIPQGLQLLVAEHQETLKPDWVLVSPDAAKKTRLLLQILPPDQGLEKPLKNSCWKASPATRLMELLHETDLRLGLLTNGEQWMLV